MIHVINRIILTSVHGNTQTYDLLVLSCTKLSVVTTNKCQYIECILNLHRCRQAHLKFSAVFGTTSANNSIFILPAGCPPIEISKNTIGFSDILDVVYNSTTKLLR